jgi:hypothetical protein
MQRKASKRSEATKQKTHRVSVCDPKEGATKQI